MNAMNTVMFGKPVSERAFYIQQLLFPDAI
jgi:hypothetical protein